MIRRLIIFALLMYIPVAVKLTSYLFYKPISSVQKIPKRADIVDANGVLLATTIPTKSVYIIPDELIIVDTMVEDIAAILNVSKDYIKSRFNSKSKKFIWILRHITPEQASQINNLNYSGVYVANDMRRFYPLSSLFVHIIGRVDDTNNGISGVELAFDKLLKESDKPLKLALMAPVQFVLKDILDAAKKEFRAQGAYGIIACAKTGRILASYSQSEEFDVNAHANEQVAINLNTQSVDERGSIFKVIAAATFLENNIVDLKTEIFAPAFLRLGKFRVHDPDKRLRDATYTFETAFSKSSNVVAGTLVLKLGYEKQKEFLERIGMLEDMQIDGLSVARGLYPAKWSDSVSVTVTYGHGFSTTNAQYLRAFLRIISGYNKELHILQEFDGKDEKRIVSETTVKKIRYLLRLAFINAWYGKRAEIVGYDIGGKTGTANKLVNGKYVEKHNLCNYVFLFPSYDPQIIGIITIDSPKPTKETFGFVMSSFITAPLAGKIIKKLGPILGYTV